MTHYGRAIQIIPAIFNARLSAGGWYQRRGKNGVERL